MLNKNQEFQLQKKDNRTIVRKTYTVESSLTDYVVVRITPYKSIDNFKILINVSGLSKLTIILLSTLIPFFFCVIFWVAIILILRKRNRYNDLVNQKYQINDSPNPLYAQPIYDTPQTQYAFQNPPQQQYSPFQPQGNQQIMTSGQFYQ